MENENKYGGLDNNTGMMLSREQMSTSTKINFMNRLLNMLLTPTMDIMRQLNNETIDLNSLSMIMNIYSSIRIDVDIFNLTILENNMNTMLLQNCYDKNKFYMISSNLVHDKKTDDICILINLYKKAETNVLDFLDDIKKHNPQIIAYLYMKELVSLSMKNYKNKFALANRARMEFFKNNPNMDSGLRDEASIALAKMAMEFQTNSMLIDNFKDDYQYDSYLKEAFQYIKNSNFILYDQDYNFKMTQVEILDKLLENAEGQYFDGNNMINLFGGNPNQNSDNESSNNDKNNESKDSEDGNGLTRNSAYTNRSDNEDNDDDNDNENNENDEEGIGDGSDSISKSVSNEDNKFLKISFKNKKNQIFFMKMPPRKPNSRYDDLDSLDENRIDRIQDYIDSSIQKIKGSGVREIFQNIGISIAIDMSWETDLIRHMDNMTSNVLGNQTESVWIKPNLYTRHISYLPGRRKIPQAIPMIYILFDQSGSMSNNVIRKINYVIEYFYKKKYDLNILIHDDSTDADDVTVCEFRPALFGSYSNEMKLEELVSSRVKCGGTSHIGVFDLMERYIEDVTNSTKKYNIQYVLICSDLYSDIESIWQKYKWIKLLNDSNIFALCPEPNMKLPFGKTLYIS